jgi:Zn-dependent peptidase ImmA (M78 family)
MIGYSKEWTRLAPKEKDAIEIFQLEIPVKIGDLARFLGVEVKISTLDVGISGAIFPNADGYKILINKHEPNYRRRFTLAHELSHFLLHRNMIGDGISDNVLYRSNLSDVVEAEANRLASDIIMPVESIKKARADLGITKSADAVSPLASQFGVSEEAMRIRLGMK